MEVAVATAILGSIYGQPVMEVVELAKLILRKFLIGYLTTRILHPLLLDRKCYISNFFYYQNFYF